MLHFHDKAWSWITFFCIIVIINFFLNWYQRFQAKSIYCDERRDILWNIAWVRGKSWGISRQLRLYFIVFPDSSHNTDILNYKSSIDLPWGSILEELILCIALTAGQYGKILPSILSNTGELNFSNIMFSNCECLSWLQLCRHILDKFSTVGEVASGLTPQEAGITGDLVSWKLNSAYLPVFALNRQSL